MKIEQIITLMGTRPITRSFIISLVADIFFGVLRAFKQKVFNTIIPRLIRLVEAPSHGNPTLDSAPHSRVALAYINLAKEVIERNGQQL